CSQGCVFFVDSSVLDTSSEASSISEWSPSRASGSSNSDSTVILQSTKARKKKLIEGPLDSQMARDVSYLQSSVLYVIKKRLNPRCSQKGETLNVRITYSLGIVTLFPNLKDSDSKTGYVNFTFLFGKEVSGKFLAKWPTFFKRRIIADCKNLPHSTQVDELLMSAQLESDDDIRISSLFTLRIFIFKGYSLAPLLRH
uniref:Uncharacterized protein n=1 Tax=Labrus bergylta TaxID=56723 RepID=A0A3Q3G2E5_9LABR